jgi:type IV secretory pathway VirB2 component (pilin)
VLGMVKVTSWLGEHRRSLTAGLAFGLPTMVAGAASAASVSTPTGTDLTGGAGDSLVNQLWAYFAGNVIPDVVLIFVTMIGFGLAVRWIRKVTGR